MDEFQGFLMGHRDNAEGEQRSNAAPSGVAFERRAV